VKQIPPLCNSSQNNNGYRIVLADDFSGGAVENNIVQYNICWSNNIGGIDNYSPHSNTINDNKDSQGTSIPVYAPAVADAGDGGVVSAGSTVTLTGGPSQNSFGSFNGCEWTQTMGPAVAWTSDTDQAIATFTAPTVDQVEIFAFKLELLDANGNPYSDTYDEVYYAVTPW
jgi:hypothetical protein